MGLFASDARSPHLSAEQLKASRASYPAVPAVCVVTGGTGFVGARLVEMLVERGAKTVRVLDVVPPGPLCWKDPRIEYTVGSICDEQIVAKVVDGADCVWHMAAAVGPFHPTDLYKQVNYEGVLGLIEACRAKGCRRIVRITGKGEDPKGFFSVLLNLLGSMAKAWNYEGECVPTPAAPAPA